MKISVIMPSWANPNKNNIEKRIETAINSFLKQTYDNKELLIISDNCEVTRKIYETKFSTYKEIRYFHSQKLPLYSGGLRNIGLSMSTGDIICYLDNDDLFGKNHLKIIAEQFDMNYDWFYYNDYIAFDETLNKLHVNNVKIEYGSIGTSSITHKNPNKFSKFKDIYWYDGYGHDFLFILQLASKGSKFKKFDTTPAYIICRF